MSFEQIIITLSYLGIFILMTGTGFLGVFPPSKIVYPIVGYLASIGTLGLIPAIIAGGLGHSFGNYLQYEISRQKGLKYISKYQLIPEKEIKKIQAVFNKKGTWFLFVGKLIDPIKLVISICAGIAKMNRVLFVTIIFITSIIWASIFILIGYYLGLSYENFGLIGLIVFIIAITVISIFYKYMNSEEILNEIEKNEKKK